VMGIKQGERPAAKIGSCFKHRDVAFLAIVVLRMGGGRPCWLSGWYCGAESRARCGRRRGVGDWAHRPRGTVVAVGGMMEPSTRAR
jgi:hypothetical protein